MAGKKEIGINVVSTGDNLEPQQVSVTFEEAKLDALLFYMQDKGTTMEAVLQEHMGELYRSFVPANARRYLDRNDPEAQQSEEPKRGAMTQEERESFNASRREKRRAEKQAQGNSAATQTGGAAIPQEDGHSGEPEEGQDQGMALGGIGA